MGFAPFGTVVSGMDAVDRIFKIGEKPNQFQIQRNGRFGLIERVDFERRITALTRPRTASRRQQLLESVSATNVHQVGAT